MVNDWLQHNKLALIGIAGSGKDYIAKTLPHHRVAFADPLRELCISLFPDLAQYTSDDKKDQLIPHYGLTARQIWIKISKTVREVDDNIWINRTVDKITRLGETQIVVTDCRTLTEFTILNALGFHTVWIDNPKNTKPLNQYDKENTMLLKHQCSELYENIY